MDKFIDWSEWILQKNDEFASEELNKAKIYDIKSKKKVADLPSDITPKRSPKLKVIDKQKEEEKNKKSKDADDKATHNTTHYKSRLKQLQEKIKQVVKPANVPNISPSKKDSDMLKTERAEKQKKQSDLPSGHLDRRDQAAKPPSEIAKKPIISRVKLPEEKKLETESVEEFKRKRMEDLRAARSVRDIGERAKQLSDKETIIRDREKEKNKVVKTELLKTLPNGQWELLEKKIC